MCIYISIILSCCVYMMGPCVETSLLFNHVTSSRGHNCLLRICIAIVLQLETNSCIYSANYHKFQTIFTRHSIGQPAGSCSINNYQLIMIMDMAMDTNDNEIVNGKGH